MERLPGSPKISRQKRDNTTYQAITYEQAVLYICIYTRMSFSFFEIAQCLFSFKTEHSEIRTLYSHGRNQFCMNKITHSTKNTSKNKSRKC